MIPIRTIPSTLNRQRMTVERVERVKNSDTIEFGLGRYSSLSRTSSTINSQWRVVKRSVLSFLQSPLFSSVYRAR